MTHSKYSKPKPSKTKDEGSLPVSTPPPKQSTWYEKLYSEQRDAADFILSRPATALFSTPGTGKTYISMAVIERLPSSVILIVAPLTSLGVTWRPRLETLPSCELLGSVQELVSSLKNKPEGIHRRIVLVNPEGLRGSLKRIDKLPWDLVIWDESQNMKQRSSVNSRIARRLRHVERRLALSGTPMDTGQIDIWAQMRFVDCEVLGENWGDFASEYCYKTGWMGKEWKFNDRKNEKFLKAIEGHVFRLNEGFLGLKPLTVIPVPVMILGRQRQIYEAMARNQCVEVDGMMISAANAGARDVKLSQITGGAVLDNEDGIHHTGQAKQRKLFWLLNKIEWPVVIFCQYLHEIDIVRSVVASSNVAVIKGGVKNRTQIVNDFQAGKIDCLICQVRTGGESIDLTQANVLILYSMTYSYINFEQIIRRLQRGGQKRAVKAYILYCDETIDSDKLDLVKEKGDKSSYVLSHFEGA